MDRFFPKKSGHKFMVIYKELSVKKEEEQEVDVAELYKCKLLNRVM